MIETITLKSLLPFAFIGMENTKKVCSSQIWGEHTLTLKRGCKVCIKSNSGNGKTTLLNFIYGNRHDYKGTILFNNINTRTLNYESWCKIRTTYISMLPQDIGLFPEMTIEQNIDIKNNLTKHKTKEQIYELLDKINLLDKCKLKVCKLSLGQMQKISIIRALCQPFDFIFLDEPVSHLDKYNNEVISSIISAEVMNQGAGIITTSVGYNLLLDNVQYISL